MPVMWLIYMARTAVPALYLAWTQPDEVPDDEGEWGRAAVRRRVGPPSRRCRTESRETGEFSVLL
ncbi:hypothetical protein [Nocardiopsis sp. CNT312]|uniref:hypothetical protein n=1 Tax=Nocardiopsis sp. CNT312 TaxID=1137268 RepID=UPI00048EFF4F|nr:hypothetical protein [Nocardiopsis sp. CNT312]